MLIEKNYRSFIFLDKLVNGASVYGRTFSEFSMFLKIIII